GSRVPGEAPAVRVPPPARTGVKKRPTRRIESPDCRVGGTWRGEWGRRWYDIRPRAGGVTGPLRPRPTFAAPRPSARPMSFTIQQASKSTAIVRIGKALDFRNAADFKASCQEYVRLGVRYFVLDFSGTGILDSTGLGVIFSLYRQLTPVGGQVVFAS